jgi:O-antigen ligase
MFTAIMVSPIYRFIRDFPLAVLLGLFLLWGLFCTQILAYFLDIRWSRKFSIILYLILGGLFFILIFKRRVQCYRFSSIDFLVSLFWLLVATSLVFRFELREGAINYLTYIPFMCVLPYFCGRLINMGQLRIFMQAVAILALIIIGAAIIDRAYFSKPLNPELRWPFFGHDHGRLMLGSLLAPALLTALFWCNSLKKNRFNLSDGLAYCFVIVITIALVWSTARGWLLAGTVSFFLMVLFANGMSRWFRLFLVISVTAAMAISYLLLPKVDPNFSAFLAHSVEQGSVLSSQRYDNALDPTCTEFESTNSQNVRLALYKEAIKIFFSAPVFGVGAGNYGSHSCWRKANSYPHNTVLQAYAELGIVGGSLFIIVLAVAFYRLLRRALDSNHQRELSVSLFAFAGFSLYLIIDQFYGNYLTTSGTWLFLGFAANSSIKIKS